MRNLQSRIAAVALVLGALAILAMSFSAAPGMSFS